MSQRRLQPGPSPQHRPRYARPSLTSLEDRTVLSTGPSLNLSNYFTDHILVRYQAGQAPVALPNTAIGGAVEGLSGLYKVQLAAGLSVPQALAAYRADARVQLAEPDYHLGSGALPNDPRFGEQWAWRNTGRPSSDVDAPLAWDYQTGSSRMIVSVMDTGVEYTHPDLYRNIWLNQGEIPASRRANLIDTNGDGLITFPDLNDPRNQGVGKITDLNHNGYIDGGDVLEPMIKLGNGADSGQGGWANDVSDDHDRFVDDLIGWNFVDDSNDPMDDFGHGTHVAGTIGAMGNNGQGVSGINWSIQMMPIKFMNANGAGSVSAFIAGLNYAIEHGAKISNNSWTGSGDSSLLAQAVQAAQVKQHIFVAAAGNSGSNNDADPVFPASLPYDNVLAVAATDRNDNLASFSNYGASSVDLAAPGVDILSTTLGEGYGYNSGTSMATPHVTGAAALIWARNPSWTYQMVINRILGSVDRLPSLAGKTRSGGRLNVGTALAAGAGGPVAPPVVTPPSVTSAAWSGPSSSSLNKVRVSFNEAIALSSFTPGDAVVTGPGGRVIPVAGVSVVGGSGDRSFDVTFAAQTAAGDYSIRVGPEVTDVTGTKMNAWSGSFRLNAVVASAPPAIVGAQGSGATANSLNRVRVTFDRSMNVSTFTAADVRLTGPTGKLIAVSGVNVVSGSSNKTFDITFATQTAAGNYAVQIGPEVTAGSGVKMKPWSGSFKVTAPTQTVTQPAIVGAQGSGTSANNLNKVRVTFDRAINLTSFTAADVRLTGPTGSRITIAGVKVVAGTSNKTFEITFATQTAAGSYTMQIGPEVVDASWTKMKIWAGVFKVPAPTQTSQPAIVGTQGSGTAANNLNKVRVTFNRSMNVGSFTGADVRLTGPGGKLIAISGVKVVSGTSNKTFEITFATQTAAGSYTMQIGPEATDGAGVKMKIWSGTFKVTAPTAPTPAKTYVSATRLAVAPHGKAVSLLTIGDNVTVADLNVKLTINHPRVSDLYIYLQAPDGKIVVLANRNGGGAVNMTNTVFDDEASLTLSTGKGPFTGNFKPVNGLYTLDGKNLKGTWKLWVEDKAGVNRGTLESWSMTVTPRAVAQAATAATPTGVKWA